MGKPMALHLLNAGHPLAVFARRSDAAQSLVRAGAVQFDSPQSLAAHCEAVFTMVTSTPDVEHVILGEGGIIHGARPGTVVIDMSTISSKATRAIAARLADRGVDMLDAPVSGGPAGAEQATLAIMVGGKPKVFERAKPLFERLGKTIVHVGDHGAGQVAKACNQLVMVVTIEAVAEAMDFARVNAVDPVRVREVLMGGFAASRVLEVLGKRMVERDFEAGIEARLHHKDFQILTQLADEQGLPMPAAKIVMRQLDELMAHGFGRMDTSNLLRVLEIMRGEKS
jgi:2-hydroxy-3-oxopropionate reductase